MDVVRQAQNQESGKAGRDWATFGGKRGSSDKGLSPASNTGGALPSTRGGYISLVYDPLPISQRLKFYACLLLLLVCFWVIGYLVTRISSFLFGLIGVIG